MGSETKSDLNDKYSKLPNVGSPLSLVLRRRILKWLKWLIEISGKDPHHLARVQAKKYKISS